MSALKKILAFLFLVAMASCIDPYYPNIKNYNSFLTVEGLITNENITNKIKLSRTTTDADSTPEKVTDAYVYITDGDGVKTYLRNCENGFYCTDSTMFTGVPNQKYTLHIITSDRNEYESDICTMIPVADIDKVYYVKGEEISGIRGELFSGLKILLNSSDASGKNKYFRWALEETWQLNIPYPQQYKFEQLNDTVFNFEAVPFSQRLCWKKNNPGEIIINSLAGGERSINGQKILFIAPIKSDRLTLQYSILVKQYSISKKEYDFWNNLKKSGEAGGDIFALQPFPVMSNLHNINNPAEMVLGFFEVSAVSKKRIYITSNEIDHLNLPDYRAECRQIAKSPDDWPKRTNPWNPVLQPTWNGIYHMYTDNGENDFIRPEVTGNAILPGHVNKKDLIKLVFAPKICAECELSGFSKRPDFWVDP